MANKAGELSNPTDIILAAKKEKGVTYEQIAEAVGRHKVWVAAVIQGQASMNETEARALIEYLDLDESLLGFLMDIPMKGSLEDTVPADPLLYRFHEITQVYGTTMKEIIHEEFGDGIMSAIDFELDVERKEDPSGDRVVITLDGKFLPYRKW
ncbi:cyanase [Bacillus piscicola]|uniref:cyanase n=1 Tax=Bacillus piscicola TaxID=1632684 RepID=UPI001F094E9B|nr:cyanase [Bacillus piscicola]